jgi:hypothetical protein
LYDAGVKRGWVIIFLFLELVFLLGLCGGPDWRRAANETTFLPHGDGRIHIRNVHTGREVNVGLLAQDGSVDQEALAALNQVFGLAAMETASTFPCGCFSARLLF